MPRSTPVADIMTTDVLSFHAGDGVREAMTLLVDREVDAGPVLDEEGRVIGILSTADLVVRDARLHVPTVINLLGVNIELPHKSIDEEIVKALGASVGDVMTKGAVTCRKDDTLEDAATLMHEHDVSRLAVVDSLGRLEGIVARGDIVRVLVREE